MTTAPLVPAPLGALAERLLDDDDLADTLASNGGQLCAPASLHRRTGSAGERVADRRGDRHGARS
jgi:hypothetical protein